MKTKIKGLHIDYDDEYIFIADSYQINSPVKMEEILDKVFEKMDYPNIKRSKRSLIKQWVATNTLYKLNVCKRFSKNCFLTDDLTFGKKVLFFLLSFPKIHFRRRDKDGRTN